MIVSIIVAKSENNVIGVNNELPFRLSNDLKNFKESTMSKPIIMGRKTHESIGRPLTGRDNIILTRTQGYLIEGCRVFNSLEQALNALNSEGAPEVMIIGGANIYEQALPFATRIFLTQVHAEIDGDTFFPEIDLNHWEEVDREDHKKDAKNEYDYSFIVLEKKS